MNYDRYFNRGQKVFLINMSDARDESVYESLTGTVISSDDTRITLKSPYRIYSGDSPTLEPGMLFKLTTESMGMGVQLCAELISTPGQETLTVKPIGTMEIYQRRQLVRVDTLLPFLHVPQKSSLSAFQREWRRVVADLHKPTPPRLKLQTASLNISAGGIRFDAANPTTLSIVVVDMQDELPPICAVTELVWQKAREESELYVCGHRFLEILKEDQQRLASFVAKKGDAGAAARLKDNWDLQDRMMKMHPVKPDK